VEFHGFFFCLFREIPRNLYEAFLFEDV